MTGAGVHNSGRNPLEEMFSVAEVLDKERLAQIYVHVLRHGPITTEKLREDLGTKQSTTYDDVKKLEDLQLLNQVNNSQPREYNAEPVTLQLISGDRVLVIKPALIAGVAQREENEDIDLFIDRHGVEGLATALEYTRDHIEGRANARIMADEMGITALEAEVILQELRSVIETVEEHTSTGQDDFHEIDPHSEDQIGL